MLIFSDTGQALSCVFLFLDIAFTEDRDPVCLWRTAAMDVGDGIRTLHGHLFHESKHLDTIFNRGLLRALQVFLYQMTNFGVFYIPV